MYHVVANDKERAITGLTPQVKSVIRDIKNKDLLIEIVNDTLVIGNTAPINPDLVIYLAAIAKYIADIA